LLAALARPSVADVTGLATVIDGDTIVVADERIRLEGIDAPELHQTCTAYGQQWACGRTSAEWLQEHQNRHERLRQQADQFLAIDGIHRADDTERTQAEQWLWSPIQPGRWQPAPEASSRPTDAHPDPATRACGPPSGSPLGRRYWNYRMAIGLPGEPVAPFIGTGAKT
jgi:hypothetical protein